MKETAQEFLNRIGTFKYENPRLPRVLACLACHWDVSRNEEEGPRAQSQEIAACTGVNGYTTRATLQKLQKAGILTHQVQKKDRPSSGPGRFEYMPAGTVLSKAFMETLVAPDICYDDVPVGPVNHYNRSPEEMERLLRSLGVSQVALEA